MRRVGVTRWRRVLFAAGEVLITLGAVVLLFVAYQVWWTNVVADRATAAAVAQLQTQWRQPPPGGIDPTVVQRGQPFALLYIPALGHGWRRPVIEGVALTDLAQGVGHYPGTALPGEVGNFAVAGHRATNGEPFAFLDRVHRGDEVAVRTATQWFVYRITDVALVAPTDVAVIDPVPGRPDAAPTQRLITLTTCNPRWASYQRLVLHGVLVVSTPADRPPAAVGA
jgi:sortase A